MIKALLNSQILSRMRNSSPSLSRWKLVAISLGTGGTGAVALLRQGARRATYAKPYSISDSNQEYKECEECLNRSSLRDLKLTLRRSGSKPSLVRSENGRTLVMLAAKTLMYEKEAQDLQPFTTHAGKAVWPPQGYS